MEQKIQITFNSDVLKENPLTAQMLTHCSWRERPEILASAMEGLLSLNNIDPTNMKSVKSAVYGLYSNNPTTVARPAPVAQVEPEEEAQEESDGFHLSPAEEYVMDLFESNMAALTRS